MPWASDHPRDDEAVVLPPRDAAPPVLPGLMLISEVASYLRKTERTIRRWIAAGQVPAVRIGGATYIREADLLALIDAEITAALPASRARRGCSGVAQCPTALALPKQ